VSAASALQQWTKATEVPAAREPPEARGLARDGVRLMVSRGGGELITHAQFRHLPDYLRPGDVVVVNTSATINASLDAAREGGRGQPGEPIELHLSTPLPGGTDRQWVIELRRLSTEGTVDSSRRARASGSGLKAVGPPRWSSPTCLTVG
jgi:S-adenosylmethionine:tRNA-ribosyltransferase-isomerase (queuine synthetase)